MQEVRILSGNEATANGAIFAGCRFFAGYPITPSTDLAERLALMLPLYGGVFIQMEDEISSVGALIGASLAGKKAMTATSGPGFSLMQEGLGFASYSEIPLVIVDVQRTGPSTGLPTFPSQGDVMQSMWGTHGTHPIIVLSPSSVLESFTLIVRAFNLAEKYRTPVIFLSDEVIGHMREKVYLPDNLEIIERRKPSVSKDKYKPFDESFGDIPPLAVYGEGFKFHITGLAHDETGFPTSNPVKTQNLIERILRKIEKNKEDIVQVEEYNLEDADFAFVAYGAAARSVKTAVINLRKEGIKVGLLRPITLWPFPSKEIEKLAKRVKKIVVAEMNMGQYLLAVDRVAGKFTRVDFIGKENGELVNYEELEKCIKNSL